MVTCQASQTFTFVHLRLLALAESAYRFVREHLDYKELLKPILYADIFDYPLTGAEIYRFLECKATKQQVDTQLAEIARALEPVSMPPRPAGEK